MNMIERRLRAFQNNFEFHIKINKKNKHLVKNDKLQ